ncbi:MAG: LemA family protein [Acidovorax sp.]|jgi:LemA protein
MWSSPLLWILVAILLFWALGAYNRLTRLRSSVVQAFGAVDAHLVRLIALLGEFDAVQGHRHISDPAVPGGTADHVPQPQGPVLDPAKVAALRGATTQMGASLAVARSQPLQRDALAALTAARSVLDVTWRSVVTEADGPGAREMLAPWSIRWEEHHAQIDLAVQVINHAAEQHDAAIHQFPARLLAWVFGFKAAKGL